MEEKTYEIIFSLGTTLIPIVVTILLNKLKTKKDNCKNCKLDIEENHEKQFKNLENAIDEYYKNKNNISKNKVEIVLIRYLDILEYCCRMYFEGQVNKKLFDEIVKDDITCSYKEVEEVIKEIGLNMRILKRPEFSNLQEYLRLKNKKNRGLSTKGKT